MRKRHLLPLLGLLLCSAPMSADVLFNVQLADGTEISIPFAKNPVVTYPSYDQIAIMRDDAPSAVYTFDQIKNFSYFSNPTAIKNVTAESSFKMDNGTPVISGLKAGEKVVLYNAAGQVLRTVNVASDGIAVVNTADIKETIIIVKTPTVSFKIKK